MGRWITVTRAQRTRSKSSEIFPPLKLRVILNLKFDYLVSKCRLIALKLLLIGHDKDFVGTTSFANVFGAIQYTVENRPRKLVN